MSADKEHTVLWWVGWIVLTLLTFFVSCWFWTGFIAERVGPMSQKGVPLLWVAAVFGTWMVLLVPLIVVMYNKVDRAYEDARLRREKETKGKLVTQFGVRSVTVDETKRFLPREVRKTLKRLPKTLKDGQLVSLRFRDGRRLDNVFVVGSEEIVGVYGRADFPFDAREVLSAQLLDPAVTQPIDYAQWLRLVSAAGPS